MTAWFLTKTSQKLKSSTPVTIKVDRITLVVSRLILLVLTLLILCLLSSRAQKGRSVKIDSSQYLSKTSQKRRAYSFGLACHSIATCKEKVENSNYHCTCRFSIHHHSRKRKKLARGIQICQSWCRLSSLILLLVIFRLLKEHKVELIAKYSFNTREADALSHSKLSITFQRFDRRVYLK